MSGSQRAAGRPRSLTLPRIIDAAIELGLKELNMKSLAAALGVNVVTLYRHVGSRDELMRLAVPHLMSRRRLQGEQGEHWAEFAIQYASNLFELFCNEPGLLTELMNGNLHPEDEMDLLEEFLQAVAGYGFSYEEGVMLHRSIGAIVLGSAVGAIGIQATLAQGHPWGEVLDKVTSARGEEELPAVRQILQTVVGYDVSRWLDTLYCFLAGVAAGRGESLPELAKLLPAGEESALG